MSRRGLWGVVFAAAAAVGAIVLVRSLRGRGAGPTGGGSSFRGNPDSMVFHREDCRLFSPGDDGPSFESQEAAAESGYRPCGVCNP